MWRIQTKQSVEKQQSEKETQKHRDEFTSHELYTIHDGATGATEEDSNSTIGEDGTWNEDDGLILEEVEIVEDKRKNMEAAVASDECEDLNAMGEEDTKTSGAPPRLIARTRKRKIKSHQRRQRRSGRKE